MRSLHRTVGLMAILALATPLVAGCGDDDDTTADSSGLTNTSKVDVEDEGGSGRDDAGEPSAPQGAPAALDFVLDDVRGGDPVDGADFAGRDLVVWFWAPWCTLCNQEAEDIAAVAAQRDDVRFLGMAGLAPLADSRDFVDRHGLDGFPHAFDEAGTSWQEFGITSQSSFAFVDDDGTIDTDSYTVLGADALNDRIDALVAS